MSASWKIALVVLATFPINIAASIVQISSFAQVPEDDTKEAETEMTAGKNSTVQYKPVAAGEAEDGLKAAPSGIVSDKRGIVSGNHSAVLSSAFTNMRTVCAFSMQHKVADHYVAITEQKAKLRMGKSYITGLAFGFGQATQFFIFALLFWFVCPF